MILITGGAGFIGANLVHHILRATGEPLVNLDKLTYAGNLQNLSPVLDDKRHIFVRGDICDVELVAKLLSQYRPRAIVNLAAETHVDRSIHDPEAFVQTNVVGTFRLLEAARAYWAQLPLDEKTRFRFLHVSTDEVYGSLTDNAAQSREGDPYAPNSPYAASKASSDHQVRAFHMTYGLPTLITNCSNNYGPYQFPEKLIPLAIHRALEDEEIPVYGDGRNVRDWLYVEDSCAAIARVLAEGEAGMAYNISASNEVQNIALVNLICEVLDQEYPRADGASYARQITFIKDRPGHDRRYAIDASKIRRELGWAPREQFEAGIRNTIRWYLSNQDWVKNVTTGAYRSWITRHYGPSADNAQGIDSGGGLRNTALPNDESHLQTASPRL